MVKFQSSKAHQYWPHHGRLIQLLGIRGPRQNYSEAESKNRFP